MELIGITAVKRKTPGDAAQRGGQVNMADHSFLRRRDFRCRHYLPVGSNRLQWQPFVLTFVNRYYHAGGGNYRFVVLTAALSGCNSGMYSCGRMLYALAKNRQLPAAIGKVSRNGVPSVVWRCRF